MEIQSYAMKKSEGKSSQLSACEVNDGIKKMRNFISNLNKDIASGDL
jgi:hypothetical protein